MKGNGFRYRYVVALTLFVAAFVISVEVSGRRWRKPVIARDTAFMEMVYAHVTVDPKSDNRDECDYELLAVGDRFRWYGGYGDYQLDSIGIADPDWTIAPEREDFRRLYRELEPINIFMLTDMKDSIINYSGKIFINYYRYDEPVPRFDWKLEEGTREVMGYECRKATTCWRGREWTAWYSDIPVSAGPWKFNGLPGLILRLEDSLGEHMFEAIEAKNHVYPIGWREKLYSKTTREKYNADLRDYKENAGSIIAASGMVEMSEESEESFKKTRLFFNPIELE